MGHTAVYWTALEVREDRLEDLRRVLELREKVIGEERSREGFAALLQRELPHLKEAFTPEGVGGHPQQRSSTRGKAGPASGP